MEYWKYKAIDKLKDYDAQKVAIDNLKDEIARLESEAISIRSATVDGTPVKGGGSRREDRLLDNIVKREECKRALERAKMSVKIVDRGMSALDKEDMISLDRMYITREKGAVSRLADEMNLLDERSVYKRVDKALRRFTLALYGITEG